MDVSIAMQLQLLESMLDSGQLAATTHDWEWHPPIMLMTEGWLDYGIVLPSYKFVYKPHENYSYI